jgi:hypothetical protein
MSKQGKEMRRVAVVKRNRKIIELTEPGVSGYTTEPLPDTTEAVEITIDWDALAKLLGGKAIGTKSGKSVIWGGVIVAKHIR